VVPREWLCMIHVDRTYLPAIVNDQGLKAEMALAINYFEDVPAKEGEKVFKEFGAYKSKPIREELMKMFAYKCAYCEFPLVGLPVEVEHFRPKGAFRLENGQLSEKGYYWLGAAWENLLPSCIDCNRERYQLRDPSDPGFSLQQPRQKAGKQNYFPLADPSKRWWDRNARNEEQPLLLDPCRDWPERHIDFTDDGIPIPLLTATGPDARGKTTIDVCGLWRDALVRQRKEVLQDLELQIHDAIQAIRHIRATPPGVNSANYKQNLVRGLDRLEIFKQPGRRFVGMASRVIADFEALRPKAEEYLVLQAQFDASGDPNVLAQLQVVIDDLKSLIYCDTLRSKLRRRLVEDFTGVIVPEAAVGSP
jgi:hypothetical protein